MIAATALRPRVRPWAVVTVWSRTARDRVAWALTKWQTLRPNPQVKGTDRRAPIPTVTASRRVQVPPPTPRIAQEDESRRRTGNVAGTYGGKEFDAAPATGRPANDRPDTAPESARSSQAILFPKGAIAARAILMWPKANGRPMTDIAIRAAATM